MRNWIRKVIAPLLFGAVFFTAGVLVRRHYDKAKYERRSIHRPVEIPSGELRKIELAPPLADRGRVGPGTRLVYNGSAFTINDLVVRVKGSAASGTLDRLYRINERIISLSSRQIEMGVPELSVYDDVSVEIHSARGHPFVGRSY